MAERRMFAKTIIDSDAFLDMPLSAQSLYFHLNMRADDDGFVNNPKKIQRMIGASDDDLKLLIAKKFILVFDSGIIVIKHWKIHNYIRGDRKKMTTYSEEMAMLETKENGSYTFGSSAPVLEAETETARQKAYKESNLPYSFEYKIRKAFYGKPCPICGAIMEAKLTDGIKTDNRIPTIQHNKPISKGGKHELGNISVICKQCNITIKDEETGSLNADEVIRVWDSLSGKCQSTDSQVTVNCQSSDSQLSAQVRLGKDSIGKDSIGKNKRDASADEVGRMIDEFSSGDSQLSDSLWAFYDMRKKIKKPLNPYAMKLILNKLREFSDDPAVQVQILNESIMNNWQSVYPLKERKQEMPKGYAPQPTIGQDEQRSLEWMKQFRARKEAEQRDNQ